MNDTAIRKDALLAVGREKLAEILPGGDANVPTRTLLASLYVSSKLRGSRGFALLASFSRPDVALDGTAGLAMAAVALACDIRDGRASITYYEEEADHGSRD